MKTISSLLITALLILSSSFLQAQSVPSAGKNYSIKFGTPINDGITFYLSSKFDGTNTTINMNRMDSQSNWKLEKVGANLGLYSNRHKMYLSASAAAGPSLTKEKKEMLVVSLVKAPSGKYYIKTPGDLYLGYVGKKLVYLSSTQVYNSTEKQAEWEFFEITQ